MSLMKVKNTEKPTVVQDPFEGEITDRLFEPDIDRRLVITPLLDRDSRIQKNTISLSLGTKYIVTKSTRYAAIDPLSLKKVDVEEILEKIELEFSGKLVLRPGQMVLAGTFEYISLPNDIAAQVGPRSTYGRLALMPATATFVHPGWRGCLTLELVNVGTDSIVIYPRMEVAQLMLQYYRGNSQKLETKYKLAIGPEFPKVWEDKNIDKLNRFRKSIKVNRG